ncbi:hypothetical protein LJC63_06755 [Ruminococcaceae bacterium OttesenSCG-928-L11]|nr:hypothetical protein [Ruminococcaceae bacterium OttesenSCG-928-L11]
MQTIQTESTTLTAGEMTQKLAVAAAEAYELGAEMDSDEILAFTSAICLMGKTWGDNAAADDALDTLDEWMKKVDEVSATCEYAEQDIFSDKAILAGGPNECGLLLLQTLQDTTDKLDREQDKECIDKVIAYIKDFWSASN